MDLVAQALTVLRKLRAVQLRARRSSCRPEVYAGTVPKHDEHAWWGGEAEKQGSMKPSDAVLGEQVG